MSVAESSHNAAVDPARERDRETFQIDPAESRFTVQAFAEGLFSAFGHNPTLTATEWSGNVYIEAGKLETASTELTVKAASLRVADDIAEKDRREMERTMREEVLEVSRYPEIKFQATTVAADRIYEGFYRIKIAGQLSLHGVTREHSMEAQVRLIENGLSAEGQTLLKQSDFRIKRVSVAAGTLKVKDEVKLSFNISAKR